MKFTFRFPYKLEEQPKIDDEPDYIVFHKEYVYSISDEEYEELCLTVYIDDWFPYTYRMIPENIVEGFLKEVRKKFMQEDIFYSPYYENKVRHLVMWKAFWQFCHEQTLMIDPVALYDKTPVPVLFELNEKPNNGKDLPQPMYFTEQPLVKDVDSEV